MAYVIKKLRANVLISKVCQRTDKVARSEEFRIRFRYLRSRDSRGSASTLTDYVALPRQRVAFASGRSLSRRIRNNCRSAKTPPPRLRNPARRMCERMRICALAFRKLETQAENDAQPASVSVLPRGVSNRLATASLSILAIRRRAVYSFAPCERSLEALRILNTRFLVVFSRCCSQRAQRDIYALGRDKFCHVGARVTVKKKFPL